MAASQRRVRPRRDGFVERAFLYLDGFRQPPIAAALKPDSDQAAAPTGPPHVTTKHEFVVRIAGATGLSKPDATSAVDAFLDSITEALKRGESVKLMGFGTFSTRNRAARTAVDPRRPDKQRFIAAATVPRFTAGSRLKASVSNLSRATGQP